MVDEILNSDADPTVKELLRHLTKTVESLQATIERQTRLIEKKDAELSELRRLVFGRKSEKMPPMAREVKRVTRKGGDRTAADKQKTKEKRAKNAAEKDSLPTEDVEHEVDESDCRCPHCGGTEFAPLGSGEASDEYEFVPAGFVRRRHVREKKACKCGSHIVTAPAPKRVSEGVQYGPGFHAHVVVSKCADSIPLNRQAKQISRIGVPMGRSTLCDIFHRSASLLSPLSDYILKDIPNARYINADETGIKMQSQTSKAYMWNFSTDRFIGYVFSDTRSGETPRQILGDSDGFLHVDQYSGYNSVTTPSKRTRVGCLAHMRRKFFDAKKTAPKDCKWILAQILKLYVVEYDAAEMGFLGTDKHLAMRKASSKVIVEEMHEWLTARENRWTPKSAMGKAVGYAIKNWKSLTRFLEDPKLRLDNNLSERMLRIIALGRKNFLFVGNEQAGKNLATLQTLVSTCELHGVNPQDYLADVLIRIQTHSASQIEELLPDKWKPPENPV